MSDRRVLLYFSWSRPAETGAPLAVIDDRFPAVFELRRLFYPRFEELAHRDHVDQGIAGFLDHVQKPNFAAFVEQAEALTGSPVVQVERVGDNGVETPLAQALIADVDTIVVISFDSFRTAQVAAETPTQASRSLNEPVGCRVSSLMNIWPIPRVDPIRGTGSNGVHPSPRLTALPASTGSKSP